VPLRASILTPETACEYSSRLVEILRLVHVPLESCPICGYALSILDHHCRHCATASPAVRVWRFDAKQLPQIIMSLLAISVLVYFVFFR
jgi:hypothetical protein